ncbi:MAG: histidine phosphatase family protein [Gloeobacteraceae cyanobacterium ES-bin-316]|nr:histidine phosphatase family protein [Ferruginibacter sp.]
MADFVNEPVPGGESFVQLHQRTSQFLELLGKSKYASIIIITHAGVVRSITSNVKQTLLKDAFAITCDYGSVTKLKLKLVKNSGNII